ncbi:Iron-sulfur cluster-binding protein [hydrothermal vent metagenome]|uniref:Iron-sulfur cluster-binding protein n=1 Tax=hydrothermal vent metagenome TaxID=652676 RepID=A0A3B1B4F6_9ZZZZ
MRKNSVTNKLKNKFIPNPQQMALMPDISGNVINGLGEEKNRRSSPIYWQTPELTPFGPLMEWFYSQVPDDERMNAAQRERAKTLAVKIPPVSQGQVSKSPEEWARLVKEVGLKNGANIIGIAKMRPEWVIETYDAPHKTVIMVAVAMDFEELKTAPEIPAAVEVIRQYDRGHKVSKAIATWLHQQGWPALSYGGSGNVPMLLIPPALECGFGELGKHGSIINRDYGSTLRLACVVTDMPIKIDTTDAFGVDDFCINCRACENGCPPEAIAPAKQLVRGAHKWYVDFDKCLPFFNENMGCAICLAVCPWSRPGVPENLIRKLARKKSQKSSK